MTLAEEVARKRAQMDHFACHCTAISEPHRYGDCSPLWHAQNWHGRMIYAARTIAEAHANYPRDCAECARKG